MNGEEVCVKLADPNSKDLTDNEKMDLVVFSSTPTAKTIYKLFELIISAARDDAENTDPADKERQIARLTVVHAMRKFRDELKSRIEFAMAEHLADVRQRAIDADLEDREKMEEIIAANFSR